MSALTFAERMTVNVNGDREVARTDADHWRRLEDLEADGPDVGPSGPAGLCRRLGALDDQARRRPGSGV